MSAVVSLFGNFFGHRKISAKRLKCLSLSDVSFSVQHEFSNLRKSEFVGNDPGRWRQAKKCLADIIGTCCTCANENGEIASSVLEPTMHLAHVDCHSNRLACAAMRGPMKLRFGIFFL